MPDFFTQEYIYFWCSWCNLCVIYLYVNCCCLDAGIEIHKWFQSIPRCWALTYCFISQWNPSDYDSSLLSVFAFLCLWTVIREYLSLINSCYVIWITALDFIFLRVCNVFVPHLLFITIFCKWWQKIKINKYLTMNILCFTLLFLKIRKVERAGYLS